MALGVAGVAALSEELEHGGAGVDCIGVELRIFARSWARKRPSPSPKTSARRRSRSCGRYWRAAVFERSAEGEVFQPTIGARDGIEVGLGSGHG